MKILIEINHPCDINFFKNAILELNSNSKIDLLITALDREPIPRILNEELPGYNITYIGKHRFNTASIIIEANILKFFKLLLFVLKHKPDKGISFSGFVLGAVLKIFRKYNIQFSDDPENKKNLFLQRLTANELYYPSFFKADKILNFNGLKEWAYLSPHYFTPSRKRLSHYGVEAKNYIFIREVSVGTTNYSRQSRALIYQISRKINSDYKVILSLENKEDRYQYPSDWMIIEEPEKDIYSLMYYSQVVISSGDSMAREGAMLGVPSIYCGVRDMGANKVLIHKGTLYKKDMVEIPNFIEQLINNKLHESSQEEFRNQLLHDWDDITKLIISKAVS